MTAVTFDTLKFVETLRASGFDESQAKGMATAIQEVQKSNTEELVTKRDFRKLEEQLVTKADVAKMDRHILELQHGIKELEHKITIRLGIMMAAMFGMFFTALRYFPPPAPTYYPAQELHQPAPTSLPPVMIQPVVPSSAK